MKKLLYIALAILALGTTGCEKDDEDTGLKGNTWSFKPDGFDWGEYRTKTTLLSVQGYQQFEVTSIDNPGGGQNGIASTVRFSFKNVNPPPTGTYKVVDYDNLEHEDEVAVYYQVYGDPRFASQAYFFSHDGTGKTISYTFKDGKVSLKCTGLPLYQQGVGPDRGLLSANISQ